MFLRNTFIFFCQTLIHVWRRKLWLLQNKWVSLETLSNLDDNTVEYLYKNAGQETCQPEMGTQSTSQLPERSGTLGVYLCHIKNTLDPFTIHMKQMTWWKYGQLGWRWARQGLDQHGCPASGLSPPQQALLVSPITFSRFRPQSIVHHTSTVTSKFLPCQKLVGHTMAWAHVHQAGMPCLGGHRLHLQTQSPHVSFGLDRGWGQILEADVWTHQLERLSYPKRQAAICKPIVTTWQNREMVRVCVTAREMEREKQAFWTFKTSPL